MPFTARDTESIVRNALESPAGLAALAEEMTEPLEIDPALQEIGRRLLMVDELPVGPMSRYLRDLYVFAGMHGETRGFDAWKAAHDLFDERWGEIRDRLHPIRFDRTWKLGQGHYVSAFKRDREAWSCSEGDEGPYGGEGMCSIQTVLARIPAADRQEIVEGIGGIDDVDLDAELQEEFDRLYPQEEGSTAWRAMRAAGGTT